MTLVVLRCVFAVSSGALVVADVSVSPSSCGVLGEVFSSDSDFEIVKPQSFSLSKKRAVARRVTWTTVKH